ASPPGRVPAASNLPSGEKAADATSPLWLSSLGKRLLLVMSQTQMIEHSPEPARKRPSGEKVRQSNVSVAPAKRAISRWVAASHIFTAPVVVPLAIRRPSGEKATALTSAACAGQDAIRTGV